MGRKGPSWLARACGGGYQAETAKRSIDLASLHDERLSTLNSLYEEASHGGKLGPTATQMADVSLDDQKALAQESYKPAASIEGANEWVESEIKTSDEQVAVRCYLKADGSLNAEPKSPSLVPLSKEIAVKADSTLVDEGSLGYNTNYDDVGKCQLPYTPLHRSWHPHCNTETRTFNMRIFAAKVTCSRGLRRLSRRATISRRKDCGSP
jgi:hypothetical protein